MTSLSDLLAILAGLIAGAGLYVGVRAQWRKRRGPALTLTRFTATPVAPPAHQRGRGVPRRGFTRRAIPRGRDFVTSPLYRGKEQ